MVLILVLYTNMSNSPNLIVRFGYLAALVLPLLNKVELYPVVIICTLGISKNTFAYPFMPTEMYYYVILSLVFGVMALMRQNGQTNIKPLFIIVLFYIGFNDLILQGELSSLVTVVFLCIMFFVCMEKKEEVGNQILPYSFILISLAVSYWALFCPEALNRSYNKVGDMQQTGWMDPNYLSAVLGMGLVVSIRELLGGDKKLLSKVVLILTAIGSVLTLLQLASRGIILAVLVSILFLISFSRVNKWVKTTIFVIAVVFVVFLYSNAYFDFVLARFEADDGTGSHRTEIWVSKLNDFFSLENPLHWLFGVGQSEGVKLGEYFGLSVKGVSTHNDFVSVLIYYGFVGVILLFAVIAYPLRICSRQIRPQIVALLIYLLLCSMSIEPLAHGNFVYLSFFFYIIQLARQSQQSILANEE